MAGCFGACAERATFEFFLPIGTWLLVNQRFHFAVAALKSRKIVSSPIEALMQDLRNKKAVPRVLLED